MIFLIVSCCVSASAQLDYNWSYSIGSKGVEQNQRMLGDDNGNIYAMYFFADTLDLDPGPAIVPSFPQPNTPATLIKTNYEGTFLWSADIYSTVFVGGQLLEVTSEYIKVTIAYTDSLIYELNGQRLLEKYDPGNHTAILTLSNDGHLIKTLQWSSNHIFNVYELITLSTGNTIIAGIFIDTLALPNAPLLVSNGFSDICFIYLDINDEIIWATSIGSTSYDSPTNLFSHDESKFYFALSFHGTIHLTTTSGTIEFSCDYPDYNSLVAAINLEGRIENVIPFISPTDIEVLDVVVDQNENVYVGGHFNGEFNFAHSSQPAEWHTTGSPFDQLGFVASYKPNSLLNWFRGYESDDYSYVNKLAIARNTDLYVAGGISGLTDLDPGPDSNIVTVTTGVLDILLSKFTLDGIQTFAYHLQGNEFSYVNGLAIFKERAEVTINGSFVDWLDCDFSKNSEYVTSNGSFDIFMINFTEENVVSSKTISSMSEGVIAWPNPVAEYLHIETTAPVHYIEIYTINGQLVESVPFFHQLSGEIDIRKYGPGLYILIAYMDDKIITMRVIKE